MTLVSGKLFRLIDSLQILACKLTWKKKTNSGIKCSGKNQPFQINKMTQERWIYTDHGKTEDEF